ncbi:flagellar hook protein FlgE [Buchnera aphidicola]|uniref:Flagellar hook protein FlgE n=1 Tax=Buchnera aphidicola str. Ua (Uroleucon ambrosiae) TaxID=1005057 RepID=G2LPJ4_BUCUM|nr:flagellar hook protein FlgE [Buchnera aphidicola]AEO08131.1 flagellar hook protein FlgE [Buchnera aphidicola str. Ua (Uroleucon ambrosiae)]
MSGSENGLRISNDYINHVSNNIANASTIGYKSSQPVFFDIFSTSLHSKNAIGNGAGILTVIPNFNNGTLKQTDRDLDFGIANEGFFRVLDTEGHIYYTRNGQFILDSNKNIVNMQGMYLTGCNQSSLKNACNTSNMEVINLKNAYTLQAKPTTEIRLKMFLNSSQANNLPNTNNSYNQLMDLENNTTYLSIYKKNGEEEKIDISFNKLDKNKWEVHFKSNNADNQNGINNTFELRFNEHGKLISDANINIKSNNSQYNDINLDLTDTIEKPGIHNVFEELAQNGYSESKLKTFHFLPNGEILGMYANQKSKIIGQILLSKFISPEKLQPENGNLWSATAESGTEIIGIAGQNGFGNLVSRFLEMSNVDLNKELINMIIAQRNYQSNAQSFKAEDKMINTLINLR